MSIYKKIVAVGGKYIEISTIFKYGFNLSPMYRRSTARIITISKDLLHIRIKLPISYKNKNYENSIFGGSMFSAVDPIPMVQLINLIGDDYVVWDKAAEIRFKKPARENLYANFNYTLAEVEEIKKQIKANSELEIVKHTALTNKENTVTFCEVNKTIYIADKAYFKEKKERLNR